MDNWKWYWKTAASLLFAAFVVLAAGRAAFAQEQRVFDQADLFSENEEEQLEEQIAGIKKGMKFDLVVVTVDDAKGKSAQAYAGDFYDGGGFGVGEDASGVLFLIDMDNREVYISSSGVMQRFLTDKRIESVQDHVYGWIQKGAYAEAAAQAVGDVAEWYQKGIPGGQYLYDEETGAVSRYYGIRWYEVLLAFAVAGFCGAAVCAKVRGEYGMKQERRQAAGYSLAYRANTQFAFRRQDDRLLDSFVTQRVLPRVRSSGGSGGYGGGDSGRSTIHHSSSGRSHGGGGRKF